MDKETLNNWRKIKEALEEANKTESFFYTRAVSILKGLGDPLEMRTKRQEAED